jgi:hypothetical protein
VMRLRSRGPTWSTRCLAAIVAVTGALGATACGTAPGARPLVLGVSGRVGPLRIDHSERSDVVAFAGRPDAERRGRSPASPFESGRYDALGYGCARPADPNGFPLVRGGPRCRTVFFIDARSGRLGVLYTEDSRYRESHGVRVGMPTDVAEQLLGRRLRAGCEDNIYFSGPNASFTVAFTGGVVHRNGTVTGGHVYALVVHGLHHDPGIFDCM